MKRLSEIKTIVATILTVILVSFLFASCARELDCAGDNPAGEFVTFNATLDDTATKTYLDGVQVKWEATDKVALWYGTLGTKMTRTDYHVGTIGEDARYATLNGFSRASSDYVAVYPQSAALDCSMEGSVTLEFPMNQEIRPGSFASGANVSLAYSNTSDLAFKNIGGQLALKVSTTGGLVIKEIRLMGSSAMAGEVEIKQESLAAGEPNVYQFNESINFLTLDCGDGLKDQSGASSNEGFSEIEGTWGSTKGAYTGVSTKSGAYSGDFTYYLVSLPGTHTGFTMTFVDGDGRTAVARSSHAFEIKRNSNTLIAEISLSDDKFEADKQVYINEIFCHEDKIELYNPNDEEVDLTGYYFTRDEGKYWAIPAGTTIAAHDYKVFTAGQTDCTLGPTWGISGDKGFDLSLFNGGLVDRIDNLTSITTIGATETYGRKTDGCAEWVVFSEGTIYEDGVCDGDNSKGTEKGDEPIPVIDYSGLVINEINGNDYDAESGNDKFIELYNGSANSLDLRGVEMKKDGETVWTGAKDKHVLAPGAYLVLYSSKSEGAKTCPAENVFSGGLSAKKAVRVQLFTPGGESIDDFNYATYSGTPAPASYGRNSGSGAWYYQGATAGAVNIDGTEAVTGLQ